MFFLNLIAPFKGTGHSTSLNYVVVVLPAVVVLLVNKWKKQLPLKLAFLIQVAGILIPLCGYVMSGFSNVNNRWIFVFSMTLAYFLMSEK